MPRNVRNFYLTAEIDGRRTRLEGGPQARDGGFSLVVRQRTHGCVGRGLHVDGRATSDGRLILEVSDAEGVPVLTHETHRDARATRTERHGEDCDRGANRRASGLAPCDCGEADARGASEDVDVDRSAGCGACVDGWVPGDGGVERCDDCARFPDDDAAAAHVAEIVRTLAANYADPGDPADAEDPPFLRRAIRED